MSKARTNANTLSELTIVDQLVKLNMTGKPVDSIMSTPTDRAPATAASSATTEVIDSITDTDTTDTTVSGAGQADKPPTASDISNSRVNPANSTTNCMHAQHDDVSVDVKIKPHPPGPIRPQRIHHKPARLLERIHVRQFENCCHQSLRFESPYLFYSFAPACP